MSSISSKQRIQSKLKSRDDHPWIWAFDDRNSGRDAMEGVPGDTVKSSRTTRIPAAVAKRLGIDLSSRKEEEVFKCFLACLLFGKPIQQEIAERAYTRLVSAGLRNPDKVLDAGWDELVRLLDEAHYVRYDFSTATKLLEVCQELKQRYDNMVEMIGHARNPSGLSIRLQEFKHIGPVTARIFTREIAPIWYRASSSTTRRLQQPLRTR